MTKRLAVVSLMATMMAVGACEDPAKGKTGAEVGSAKPVPSATGTPAAGASYSISAADSKFEFIGSKLSGKHEGGFKTFSGTAKLVDGKAAGGSVEVEVDMASVYSDADGLTKHLQNDDFFDVPNHPKTKFVSTSVTKGGDGGTHTIEGNLTLRGETKSIKFPATVKVTGDSASVDAEFKINRKDFKIMYEGKKDDLIRDDVVIKLALKLKKK